MGNLILDVDSYKASHFKQYPPKSEIISSYIESRGGMFSHVLFFGLQRFLIEYLSKPITLDDINYAQELFESHGLIFNRDGWLYILNKYNGYLPLKISSVDEGKLLPISNPLIQVQNTDPKCAWLTGYIETQLLRAIWYPTTVATLSFAIKQKLIEFYKQSTNYSNEEILEKVKTSLHDFGSRGASSAETSAIGGLSHLVSFTGTDTILSIEEARKYYDCHIAGYSIPAAEHSTITTWGQQGELDAYINIIDNFLKPGKSVAIVCDSYNLENALRNLIGSDEVKQKIIKSEGTLIIRPDSGDPAKIVLETAQILEEIFGVEYNESGYKVLPDYIRIIQGDGINYNSIVAISSNLIENGFSIENVSFGMGAELQQKVNRDTCRFAMKASAIYMNGEWHDAFKSPITDPSKTSKRGVLKLININGEFKTVRADDAEYSIYDDQLITVFENGKILKYTDLNQIRQLSSNDLSTQINVKS